MTKEWDEVFDINASIKIFRHISSGIYRNPANAIKELVINAFDVGATNVHVKLGGPLKVSRIEIIDDGQGMAEEDMVFSFKHVGASLKRLMPEKFPKNRPLVGQFGIGLLAAAHASTLIKIESTPVKEDYTLEIEIDLSPFFKYEKQIETLEEFTYGSLKYKRNQSKKGQPGTKVILERKGNEPESRKFWDSINRKGLEFFDKIETQPRNRFAEFVEWIDAEYTSRSISDLRGYEEFVWNLGLILPIEYVSDGPIRKEYLETLPENSSSTLLKEILDGIKTQLSTYNFHVFVDGMELKRPILLPTDIVTKSSELKNSEWGVFPISYTEDKNAVEGYLFFQPYRIKPMELRGIYPRLKGVGIGQYDNTLFKMVRQNPIFAYQLSGELNLKSGFDDALNLDRTGFIETDEAYINLLKYLNAKFLADDDAILRQVRVKASHRQERKSQEKLYKGFSRVKQICENLFPNFDVEQVEHQEWPTHSGEFSDYALIRIDYEASKVFMRPEIIDNTPLVSVVLTLERIVRDSLIDSSTAEEIRSAIRKVLA